MEINLESITWYVLLIDAIGANLLAWGGAESWWRKHMAPIGRFIPLSRGWTSYYLMLVLLFGFLLYRNGLLFTPF